MTGHHAVAQKSAPAQHHFGRFDTASMTESFHVLRGHSAGINVVRFMELGGKPTLATGCCEGEMKIWDVATRRPTATIQIHPPNEKVRGVLNCVSDPGGAVVSQGRDGIVKMWDMTSFTSPVQSFNYGGFSFCKMVYVDGLYVVPGDPSYAICAYDARIGVEVMRVDLGEKQGMVTSLDVASHSVVFGTEAGFVGIWDLKSGAIRSFTQIVKNPVLSLCTKQGRGILGTNGGQLVPFKTTDSSCIIHRGGVISLDFEGVGELRSFGKWFSAALWDHTTRIYEWKTCKEVSKIRYHQDSVQSLDMISDNRGVLLATGSNDKRVVLCRIGTSSSQPLEIPSQ